MAVDSKLQEIQLLGVPVSVWARTRVWFEGLIREFDIITTERGAAGPPKRLVAFIRTAREDFGQFSGQTSEPLESAHQSNVESVDLEIELPETAGEAALSLLRHLEEAEEFCREGDLLTMTSAPDVHRFYTWYLTEIARQLKGEEPIRWEEEPPTGPVT